MIKLKKIYSDFKTNMEHANKVLGMNRRNLGYVYPSNPRKYFEYANNKLLTKKVLEENSLSTPITYFSVSYFYELQNLEAEFRKLSSFVIKPSNGSGGNGIIVVSEYKDGKWFSISGKELSFEAIKKHVADIIFGVFSFGLNDTAIIEERILQNDLVTTLSPHGLADIRMINYKGVNLKAMLRIATIASDGKANLHQGGVGVAIELKSGLTFSAQSEKEYITHHPDTNVSLLNVEIPHWEQLSTLCEDTAKFIPMEYLGIDIALSHKGPVILEVNARPGIEIQNISRDGMREGLIDIDKRRDS